MQREEANNWQPTLFFVFFAFTMGASPPYYLCTDYVPPSIDDIFITEHDLGDDAPADPSVCSPVEDIYYQLSRHFCKNFSTAKTKSFSTTFTYT